MKNNRFMKGLAAAMTLTLTAASFSACAGGSTGPTATSSASATTSKNSGGEAGLEKYDSPVTVTMFASVSPTVNFKEGESFEDNLWTRLYKDELNINVEYKWIVTEDQYAQKFNIAISSRDFADIMNFNPDDKNMKLMYDGGYLQDMTNVYAKYVTKYTKSLIEADDGTALKSGQFNGKQIGIPNTNSAVEATNVLWIRKDWLEKSGKSAPKTLDELYNLAETFQKANYDGVANVYGISMDKGSETDAIGSVKAIFSGYKSYPAKWIQKDGKLVYGSVQPETKEALTYLAKMYANGLIDKEYGVKDSAKVGEDACSGHIGLYLGGHASPLWPLNATTNKSADWTPYPIPTADGSEPVQVVNNATQNFYVVTKDCKHPEAVMKLMNLFTKTCFSDEGNALYFITSDQYREPFKFASVQTWPQTKNIDIYKRIKQYRDTNDESTLKVNEETRQMFEFCKKYDETGVREGGWDYKRIFDVGGSEGILSDYRDKGNVLYNGFYGAPTTTMASKKASLDKLEAQAFAQIIMGASSIDEFDNFVSQWNSLGGSQITQEVNNWAAAQKG